MLRVTSVTTVKAREIATVVRVFRTARNQARKNECPCRMPSTLRVITRSGLSSLHEFHEFTIELGFYVFLLSLYSATIMVYNVVSINVTHKKNVNGFFTRFNSVYL